MRKSFSIVGPVGGYGREVGDLAISVGPAIDPAVECCTDLDCDDDNVCTWEQCRQQTCVKVDRMFGDVCGATFTAEPNGAVNLTDVLCTLNAFGLGNLHNCPNADIVAVSEEHCPGDNDVVNLTDILKVLDAFGAPTSPEAMFFCPCSMNP